jgi:hypothetical protein
MESAMGALGSPVEHYQEGTCPVPDLTNPVTCLVDAIQGSLTCRER